MSLEVVPTRYGAAAVDALARAAAVVGIDRRLTARLSPRWYDETDLMVAATAVVRAAGQAGTTAGDIERVVVHLPQQLSAAGAELLLALAGIASAAWQHFYAAPSGSCNLTLADKIINGIGLDAMLPDVFAPRATCADAAVSLFGVPYDFWSLGLFVLLALAALVTLAGRRRR